jgi:DNA-binding NarL/FixJ family response regulator
VWTRTLKRFVLSSTFDPSQNARAIEPGAAAVLDNTTHLGHIPEAVRCVLAGERLPATEEQIG